MELMKIVNRDCHFLETHNLMDYSLLLVEVPLSKPKNIDVDDSFASRICINIKNIAFSVMTSSKFMVMKYIFRRTYPSAIAWKDSESVSILNNQNSSIFEDRLYVIF
jgi:hypothetical protein